MRTQIKRFGPYAHSMGGGPRVIGTAGRRREKKDIRYRMLTNYVNVYYDIVC
jgi:hypothetical protein